jgi:hypothetical protein
VTDAVEEPGREVRLFEAGLSIGLDEDEAERASASALERLEWRRRRGGKECASCHETKRVADFGLDSSRRDGLHNSCRACRSVKG